MPPPSSPKLSPPPPDRLPEPPDLALETLQTTLQVPPLTRQDLWLALNPTPEKAAAAARRRPPPDARPQRPGTNPQQPTHPIAFISKTQQEHRKDRHFLQLNIDSIIHAGQRMQRLHQALTLPLPNPADPQDPYAAAVAPAPGFGLIHALFLPNSKRELFPDQKPQPRENPEDKITPPGEPRLLPLGLYEYYVQEINQEQERRRAALQQLLPRLKAWAEQYPPQPEFLPEQARPELLRLIRIELSFQASPTLAEFAAAAPPELPQGNLSRLLAGTKPPGWHTATLYYAAGHAARRLTKGRQAAITAAAERNQPWLAGSAFRRPNQRGG